MKTELADIVALIADFYHEDTILMVKFDEAILSKIPNEYNVIVIEDSFEVFDKIKDNHPDLIAVNNYFPNLAANENQLFNKIILNITGLDEQEQIKFVENSVQHLGDRGLLIIIASCEYEAWLHLWTSLDKIKGIKTKEVHPNAIINEPNSTHILSYKKSSN